MKLPNRIPIYDKTKAAENLKSILNKFLEIWKNYGSTAKISKAQWMTVPLQENWQGTHQVKQRQAKIYPLGAKDKAIVDEEFNKLHKQGRVSWSD